MRRSQVSSEPKNAPKNYRELPPKVMISGGSSELWETWHGSGVATEEPCGDCGNVEGNLQIYGNAGTSYPNGNQWDDSELVCGRCGRYTQLNGFVEG